MTVKKENPGNVTVPSVASKPAAKRAAPLVRFLREVRAELVKTEWPSRDELIKFSVVVMLTILAVAVYLGLSDMIAAQFMKLVGIVRPVGR